MECVTQGMAGALVVQKTVLPGKAANFPGPACRNHTEGWSARHGGLPLSVSEEGCWVRGPSSHAGGAKYQA